MSLITIDCRMYDHSGIGTYLRNLLASPRLLRTDRHTYRLLGEQQTLRNAPQLANASRIKLIECRAPIYGVAEQLALARSTPRGNDLFWSPHYNIPLFARGKLLVTVHDVNHLALAALLDSAAKRWYARAMFAAVRAKARRIICDSRFTADELVRHTNADAKKISVIHAGVSAFWHPVDAPRPEAAPYLIYVGNVKPHKNLRRLIAAFAQVLAAIPHRLLIVGRKEGFLTADAAVEEAAQKLRERIRFTGYLDDATLRTYLTHADALVLPSLYEGFGLPPLEAMACGCATLVSRAASLPEVCGEASLYCDPLDLADIARQLLAIANDRALRTELREKGRQWVRQYDWERCAQATAQVIDEVLGE